MRKETRSGVMSNKDAILNINDVSIWQQSFLFIYFFFFLFVLHVMTLLNKWHHEWANCDLGCTIYHFSTDTAMRTCAVVISQEVHRDPAWFKRKSHVVLIFHDKSTREVRYIIIKTNLRVLHTWDVFCFVFCLCWHTEPQLFLNILSKTGFGCLFFLFTPL